MAQREKRLTTSALLLLVLLLLACITSAHAFYYLPGVAPRNYAVAEDSVPLKVNSLSSAHTVEPLWYYDLPFCRPIGGIIDAKENLGEILSGDRIENSPYEVGNYPASFLVKLRARSANAS